MMSIYDINIDLANYADDISSYAYHLENEKVINLLEKILTRFLTGSQITF